jgi:hypothetical protein
MLWSIITIAVGLILVAAAFHLRRIAPNRPVRHSLLSPVTQQHLHLFQGGRLSEAAIEMAKATLGGMLARGDRDRAEASLRPGLHYAVQVQALGEMGGAPATELLQRQLQRRVSNDPVEQSWYWIDVAHSLRALNSAASLPHLLRCPANGDAEPLGQYYAAEAVCCPGYLDALRRPDHALGRAAVRLLHLTLHGLRHGVSAQVIAEARLGTAVATLWKRRPERTDPRVVRVLIEALRLVQRSDHIVGAQRDRPDRAAAIRRELREMRKGAAAFTDYLSDAPGFLLEDLAAASNDTRADVLLALSELRADAAAVVTAQLHDWPAPQRQMGVRLLRWSQDREAARWLLDLADATVHPPRRARRTRRATPPNRPSVPDSFPYLDLLYALRGHASLETEALLLLAARDWDPTVRTAAVGSFGWWEPLARPNVLLALQESRDDPNADVRRAAEAALARLGERGALRTIRGWLVGESDGPVLDAIRTIAAERIYWLWSDLDALADGEDIEAASVACEALEQMREDLAGGLLVH